MPSLLSRIFIAVLLGCTLMGTQATWSADLAAVQRFSLSFYAEPIAIEYDPRMVIRESSLSGSKGIEQMDRTLKRRPLQPFINSLLKARSTYQLNDFLFYRLARQSLSVIYEGRDINARKMSLYRILIEAGFDARLTYIQGDVFVNVYTKEDLFEIPIVELDGRPYANLSCVGADCRKHQKLFIYDEHPNTQGRSFGFQLDRWPRLTAQPVQRDMQFSYFGEEQYMKVTFDQTIIDIMADYPFINEYCYLQTPLSATLQASLLPQLQYSLAVLDTREQLEFLASFTRSGFAYKDDHAFFGRSKPMVPEELFGYSFSDCEDRSALFYALVRDLLQMPMAVIAYDDHLTIAIGSDELEGDSFLYEGQRYVFCDPTGPRNSSRIGAIPPGYENKKFSIIGLYK